MVHTEREQLLCLCICEVNGLPVYKHVESSKSPDIYPLSLPCRQQFCPVQHFPDIIAVIWFSQIIVRLHLQGIQRILLISCHEDDHQIRKDLSHFLRKHKPIHPRHLYVQKCRLHHIIPDIIQRLQRIKKRPRNRHPRYFIHLHRKLFQRQPLIVYNNNPHSHHSSKMYINHSQPSSETSFPLASEPSREGTVLSRRPPETTPSLSGT